MYTYDPMVINGAMTLLRPVTYTILVVTIISFIILLFPKEKQNVFNGYSIVGLSVVLCVIAAQILYFDGILADELGLGGDELSFILTIVIGIFSLVNIILYSKRHMTEKNK